jgi:tetratricopeptide (TPR) repeat protein
MRSAFASIVTILALAAAAKAQDDPMAHYDAYSAAMSEGRVDDAVAAGMAAWRAAESAWGDSRETAVLAYNIASLDVRLGRSADAVEPAARALQLAESGVAEDDVPVEDAALVLGLAEFGQTSGASGADHLRGGLEGRGDAPAEIDDLVALGWISLALEARGRERWKDATEHAREARMVAARLGPDFASLAVDAASMEAAAAIEDSDWVAARGAYREALRAYPASAAPATDPRLASLVAWEFATAMVLQTQFERQRRTGTNFDPRNGNERFEREGPVRLQQSCYSWVEPRREPVFPASQEWRGLFGAVVVTYDVNPSGALENVRVAATAPANLAHQYSDEVMEDVPSWHATVAPNAADACLKNQTITFGFYFE